MAENTSARARQVGAELEQLRTARGLSQRELAKMADISSNSRISEAEAGKRLLRLDEISRILDALEVTDVTKREQLLDMIRASDEPGLLIAGAPGVDQTLVQLIEHEHVATQIIDASPLMIPGLLQTSDYARAIMGDGADSKMRVALRAGRSEILTRVDPVELVALIDSEALVRPVATPRVMLHQLQHVLKMAERPNVTVQVVSSTRPGYHPMLSGPFELIQFAKAAPIVLFDHHASSAFLWENDDVQQFVEAAEFLRTEVAMTPARSAEVIERIVKGMESTT